MMGNRISNITRRDIFNLFIHGLNVEWPFGDSQHITYPYYGSLSEFVFLNRLYNFKEMKSDDSRYDNAERDIWQHTENNDDYEYGWVFSDERFPLKKGKDEDLLNFLCEVFHPEVRYEKGDWKDFLVEVNRLLSNDDFELYPTTQISNHDVYGWRIKSLSEIKYMPFSLRNKEYIDSKQLNFSIKKYCREQIIKTIKAFNETLYSTDNIGYNYNSDVSTEALKELSTYYEPRCFNRNQEFVKTKRMGKFIMGTRPYCVFDIIEIFAKITNTNEFVERINSILSLNKLPYLLKDGIIQKAHITGISDEEIGKTPEVGITELLQKAQLCYNAGKKDDAVEKLWDAFERLKTFYTDCDKKASVSKLMDVVSKGNVNYKTVIDSEFSALSKIGNSFRIRHHETDKIDINDDRYYDYFYSRCLSSISLLLSFINSQK